MSNAMVDMLDVVIPIDPLTSDIAVAVELIAGLCTRLEQDTVWADVEYDSEVDALRVWGLVRVGHRKDLDDYLAAWRQEIESGHGRA